MSSSRSVKPLSPFGGLCIVQSSMICCTDWFGAPHSHSEVDFRPHLFMASPNLLYDHILCDGQCFLFVRSMNNDHPSDATNDRVRWDFLPHERPPRLQGISKNRGWQFNIRSQSCIITKLCLDTFQAIQLI